MKLIKQMMTETLFEAYVKDIILAKSSDEFLKRLQAYIRALSSMQTKAPAEFEVLITSFLKADAAKIIELLDNHIFADKSFVDVDREYAMARKNLLAANATNIPRSEILKNIITIANKLEIFKKKE